MGQVPKKVSSSSGVCVALQGRLVVCQAIKAAGDNKRKIFYSQFAEIKIYRDLFRV